MATLISAFQHSAIFYLILIPVVGVLIILFTNVEQQVVEKAKEEPIRKDDSGLALPWPTSDSTGSNLKGRVLASVSGLKKLNLNYQTPSSLFNIALFFSLLNLFVSIVMWYFFNNYSSVLSSEVHNMTTINNTTQFQFVFEINQFSFGVDGISIFFVLLTTFITPIALFSSYDLFVNNISLSSQHLSSPSINIKQDTNGLTGEEQLTFSASNLEVHSLLKKESTAKLEIKASANAAGLSEDTIQLKVFLISILLLESLQICAFVSLDLLLFYVFFESVKW